MTAAKKRGRGRPKGSASADVIRRGLDDELTMQMRATAKTVFARIEALASSGEDIPIALLGAARLLAEWHTDYLTVQSATGALTPPPAAAEEGR